MSASTSRRERVCKLHVVGPNRVSMTRQYRQGWEDMGKAHSESRQPRIRGCTDAEGVEASSASGYRDILLVTQTVRRMQRSVRTSPWCPQSSRQYA